MVTTETKTVHKVVNAELQDDTRVVSQNEITIKVVNTDVGDDSPDADSESAAKYEIQKAVMKDYYDRTSLERELQTGFNDAWSLRCWNLLVIVSIVADEIVTLLYFTKGYFKQYHAWPLFVVTGGLKLWFKWSWIREQKLIISKDNKLYNVIEYRLWSLRYYDTYIGRTSINFSFDYVTVYLMQVSVVFFVTYYVNFGGETDDNGVQFITGFEFINIVFGLMFVSNLMLTYNKAEAFRLTFSRLWLLYLSYFTFKDQSDYVNVLYAVIFILTTITLQMRIVKNYFGEPTLEEFAVVYCPSFRHAYLVQGATKFCIGYSKNNEYCAVAASQYRSITDPRFFTIDDMQQMVPGFDVWKLAEGFESMHKFHLKYALEDRIKAFKYIPIFKNLKSIRNFFGRSNK